jgi:Cu+-exporting ATPase
MPDQKPEKRRYGSKRYRFRLTSMTNRIQKLNLPVNGMTCGNCVSHVDAALKKLPGVSDIKVDLETRQASLNYDTAVVDILEIYKSITDAGYTVPTSNVTLHVSGMSCVSCLAHVEGALQGLPGVVEAGVSLSQGKAQVQYIPYVVTTAQMEAAVREAGYQAQAAGEPPIGQERLTGKKEKTQTGGESSLMAWVKKSFSRPGNH